MESLKKNLHFVILISGILIGIVLLGVGIMQRGGKAKSLADAQTKLAAAQNVKTKGELDRATSRSEKFGETLKEAETAVSKGKNVSFNADYTDFASGGAFFTSEANAKLRELESRFAAMEKPLQMPALLTNYKFTESGGAASIWEPLRKDMASPATEKIRYYQRGLRIMDEVATTCERLLESGVGSDFGVKLLSFKFDEYAPYGGANPDEAPWMAMGFQAKFECAPDFAVLLAAELANPTTRTTGKTAGGNERRGFPIFLDLMQTEMKERPPEVRFDISQDDKADVAKKVNEMLKVGDKIVVPDDPKQLDPDNGEGKKLVDAIAVILNEKDVIALPVSVGLSAHAATLNKQWKVVAEPKEE